MKKNVLFLACIACIGCQQSSNMDRFKLIGTWQNTEDPHYFYIFDKNGFIVDHYSDNLYDVCRVPFSYELYNNQIISSSVYHRPEDEKQEYRDRERFTVVYNYRFQNDSILQLTLKSCDMDNDYIDPCGWTPQKNVNLKRISNDR